MTNKAEALDLIEVYTEYLAHDFEKLPYENGLFRVVTPFLRPDGDQIEFFIVPNSKGGISISDEGQTFDWFFASGFDLNSQHRRLIRELSLRYEINITGEEIRKDLRPENTSEDIHLFLEGLRSISQLTILRQPRNKSDFRDKVALYLIQAEQKPVFKYEIEGYSLSHRIDFYINSQNNLLIETLSANSARSVQNRVKDIAFKWIDIERAASNRFRKITLIDDITNQAWYRENFLRPLDIYSDKVVFWSEGAQLDMLLKDR